MKVFKALLSLFDESSQPTFEGSVTKTPLTQFKSSNKKKHLVEKPVHVSPQDVSKLEYAVQMKQAEFDSAFSKSQRLQALLTNHYKASHTLQLTADDLSNYQTALNQYLAQRTLRGPIPTMIKTVMDTTNTSLPPSASDLFIEPMPSTIEGLQDKGRELTHAITFQMGRQNELIVQINQVLKSNKKLTTDIASLTKEIDALKQAIDQRLAKHTQKPHVQRYMDEANTSPTTSPVSSDTTIPGDEANTSVVTSTTDFKLK